MGPGYAKSTSSVMAVVWNLEVAIRSSLEVGSIGVGMPRSLKSSGLAMRGDLRALKAPMIPPDRLLLRELDLLRSSTDGFFVSRMTRKVFALLG